jgi:hypothetical protein
MKQLSDHIPRKKGRFLTEHGIDIGDSEPTPPIIAGCCWSLSNWSCAYDAVITCLAVMYREQSNSWRNIWKNESSAAQLLATDFDTGLSPTGFQPSSLDNARDHVRDFLYATNPNLFP